MSQFHPDNEQLVLDCALLSQLAYCTEATLMANWKQVCPRLVEKPAYFSSTEKDAQAIGCLYRLYDETTILIMVYRGTSSLADAVTDIQVTQVPLSSKVTKNEIDKTIKVHKGFFLQYASLEKDMIGYLLKMVKEKDHLNIQHILFSGHSLGASICSIAASIPKLLPEFQNFKIGLMTFGSPRLGLQSFANFLRTNVDWIIRIKNARDPVVSILPQIYGYVHTTLDLRQIGKTDAYPDSCNLFDIQDHYIASYIKALQKDPLGTETPPLSWTQYIRGTIVNKPLSYLQSWAW